MTRILKIDKISDDKLNAIKTVLHYVIYHPTALKKETIDIVEDILFKELGEPRYNLITNEYEKYNQDTNRFESC